MSTPLTDRINSLTSQANEVTGASDTTLSDAVESLIAGYGGSGNNDYFDVVERFSYSENTLAHTFEHTGAGAYIFCEEPILTYSKAMEESRGAGALFSGVFFIHQSGSGYAVRAGTSLIFTNSHKIDFYGTGATLSEDSVTIKIAASTNFSFKAGINYVILKTKI